MVCKSKVVSFFGALLTLTQPSSGASEYTWRAEAAARTLQQWYNRTTGLWDTTGWWNSANCLTVLADLAAVDRNAQFRSNWVFQNTLVQAQRYNLQMIKVVEPSHTVHSFYWQHWPYFPDGWREPPVVYPTGFLNNYYDDEGWWALGWIQVYDVTGQPQYLEAAMDIFEDMKAGYTTPCNGGIWWSKDRTYVNAIANELFLSVAAHLANRAQNKQYYLDWAVREWEWFQGSGMINAQNTINDGLTGACQNNNGTVWSYNQGVILGGLVELARAQSDQSYIATANTIALAAINALGVNGVLHDPCEPNCGADGAQFKGVFMRNLQILQEASPNDVFRSFIRTNADSIWANDRNARNELSVVWSGPFVPPANASTQSSALDALVAAAAVL